MSALEALLDARESYRALWGRAGSLKRCAVCGERTQHRPDALGFSRCVPCTERWIKQLAIELDATCSVCGSPEHDGCGFCARCHEHAVFDRDERGRLWSVCCGAGGDTYDAEPGPYAFD